MISSMNFRNISRSVLWLLAVFAIAGFAFAQQSSDDTAILWNNAAIDARYTMKRAPSREPAGITHACQASG